MKNKYFNIVFNSNSGGITSLQNPTDENRMNWCIGDGDWGLIRYSDTSTINPLYNRDKNFEYPQMVEFKADEKTCTVVYENQDLKITVERYFSENGNFNERYTIKNLRESDFFSEHGRIGVMLPFNDVYTYADECMTNRCNTHIWCGGNVTYINALRMGESDMNLGLVFTSGKIKSYSVQDCKSNHRGKFILNFDHFELLSGEEIVFEYQMFWHKGNEDFYAKLAKFENFINIKADRFTVFSDEKIRFSVLTDKDIAVSCDGEFVEAEITDEGYNIEYTPTRLGRHKFLITSNNLETYAEFFVAEVIETLLKKRIDFIVDKQQYHRADSPLDGAFLIYDNKEKEHVFDSVFRDHNACRERTGMALLIAKYLQSHNDDKVRKALDKYIAFVFREIYDSETGEVFDGIHKNAKFKRLYNAPWIVTLFTEMYLLTEDKAYLHHILKILTNYYSVGGERFYPNGLSMRKTVEAFSKSGLCKETETVKEMFIKHVNNMVANGTSYPKHEVNYEQTIVSPTATFISEMASITGDEKYKLEAKKHIKILERFGGKQPSFHLNEIPIRYWDGYWFGKSRLFGDTFPHYWSCLTARAFSSYFDCSNEAEYKESAKRILNNCLCLFNEKGEGSCAYIYPFEINDIKGGFYDEWANDQDFALYFHLVCYD